MSQSVETLNRMPADQAEAEFLKCCGAERWARVMAAARPFADTDALFEQADTAFELLDDDDWREAFRAHPRIGEKKAATAQTEIAQRWSAEEQSQTMQAAPEVRAALAEANLEYERRFGFIFIVCASGKAADEMLGLLKQRLANPPAAELRIAAKEQKKITALRLQRLLESKPE